MHTCELPTHRGHDLKPQGERAPALQGGNGKEDRGLRPARRALSEPSKGPEEATQRQEDAGLGSCGEAHPESVSLLGRASAGGRGKCKGRGRRGAPAQRAEAAGGTRSGEDELKETQCTGEAGGKGEARERLRAEGTDAIPRPRRGRSHDEEEGTPKALGLQREEP